MDEGIVERGEDTGNAEDELAYTKSLLVCLLLASRNPLRINIRKRINSYPHGRRGRGRCSPGRHGGLSWEACWIWLTRLNWRLRMKNLQKLSRDTQSPVLVVVGGGQKPPRWDLGAVGCGRNSAFSQRFLVDGTVKPCPRRSFLRSVWLLTATPHSTISPAKFFGGCPRKRRKILTTPSLHFSSQPSPFDNTNPTSPTADVAKMVATYVFFP